MKDKQIRGNRKAKRLHSSDGLFCINCIFERNPLNGLYTEEALLYQDILEYFHVDMGEIGLRAETIKGKQNQALQITSDKSQAFLGDKQVNTWNLTRWLLDKNLGLKEYYSTGYERYMTTSTKISNRLLTIQKQVSNLAELDLLKEVTIEPTKNGQSTPVYSITNDGIIILRLIRYSNSDQLELSDKDKMEQILFQLIQKHFSGLQSYIGDFKSNLYGKSMQKGFSSHMLRFLLKILHNNKHIIYNLNNALDVTLHAHLAGLRTRKIFLDIYFEVLNGLNEDERKIILYHEKADIESRIYLARPPKDWEVCWVENISDYSKLVLYGKCRNCFRASPVIVDYVDYRMNILLRNGNVLKMNCNKCNSQNSLEVHNDITKLKLN